MSLAAICLLLFFSACNAPHRQQVDDYNDKAYAAHYRNLDSVKIYAKQALALSNGYNTGKAEALNNLAFVYLMQMHFDKAYATLNEVMGSTDDQVELLVADIQMMRLCQRESNNKEYYDYNEEANKRFLRINEDKRLLTDRQRRRMVYARSEYAIVSSTYYYYVGLEQPSVRALSAINPDGEIQTDMPQLLAYLYNVGAGGIFTKGKQEEINQKEFDYLIRCYMLAIHHNYPYWEANSLQALSEHLVNDKSREALIRDNLPSFKYLKVGNLPDSLIAGNLAERSLSIFQKYGDVYQTAGSYRTLASCYLQIKDYRSALICLQNALKTRTVIFDREENEAGALSGQKGTYVELSEISEDLQNAVIATEDRSFYKNSGINYGRFFLAILTAGRSGGGSTITQQLAKNAYLSQDQTVQRKAKEFFLALELTKKYSKKEILTMYLNNAYFGNGVWGVEDASKKYFGVSASELTLDEAATLAGMLKGPELYNPLNSIEHSTNRRDTVLQNMVAAGYLDKNKEAEAASVDMASQLKDSYEGKISDYRYPSYFDAVVNEAIEKYNLTEEEIVNNGYRIYTELDQNYQANMQVIYQNTSLFPTAEDGTHAESGSVALEPKTGGVRGVVGRVAGDDKTGFRNFNYATQSKRSPGSTIKPLIVYTPAVEAGWSLNKELDNHTMQYGDYKVDNYAGIKTSREVPMYQALAKSLNLPAVATVKELGIDKAFEAGEKFGLNMSDVDRVLGVALGGGVETNPLQMAQAYAVFANEGLMPDAHFITRIENASGQVIATHKNTQKRVVDKSVADKMTSMMLGTFTNGTGISSSPDDYVMAGKTGTTEAAFNPEYTSDQWVIGYTPDLVISHWLGFPTTDENHYLAGSTSNGAAHIFRSMAETILPYTPGSTFTVENAYKMNGIAPENTPKQTTSDTSAQSDDILSDIRGRAQNLVDEAGRAFSDAKIKEKAQTVWDTIVDLFR